MASPVDVPNLLPVQEQLNNHDSYLKDVDTKFGKYDLKFRRLTVNLLQSMALCASAELIHIVWFVIGKNCNEKKMTEGGKYFRANFSGAELYKKLAPGVLNLTNGIETTLFFLKILEQRNSTFHCETIEDVAFMMEDVVSDEYFEHFPEGNLKLFVINWKSICVDTVIPWRFDYLCKLALFCIFGVEFSYKHDHYRNVKKMRKIDAILDSNNRTNLPWVEVNLFRF